MKTPKHFSSSKQFTLYILDCAFRDRMSYLDSITPTYGEPDEETIQLINETNEELKAIQNRSKAVRYRGADKF